MRGARGALLLSVALVLGAATAGRCEEETRMHLFILSGQSNMARMDPAQTFTPAVEEAFGPENVIVAKGAWGGEPIRRWHKGWRSADGERIEPVGDLYDRLMETVRAAAEGKEFATVTFVWMQGERDAREGHGGVYGESLNGLIEQLSADLGREDLHVVIGRLSDHGFRNPEFPHWTMVRDAQLAAVDDLPRAAWVDCDDLNDGLNEAGERIEDDLHYSVEGYRTLGARFAAEAIKLIRGD